MREANLFCLFVFVFSKWINWGVIACDRKLKRHRIITITELYV